MSLLDGSTILITGASSGIGAEFARQLAGRARTLVLVARRVERLQSLEAELRARHPQTQVEHEACDVADGAALEAMFARVCARHGAVDVVINNAGLGDFGVFDRAAWTKTQQMIDVNITALARLTRLAVEPMVARRRGGVLNVSSSFGLVVLPGFAAYLGTKHFVTGFTEALRLDLAGTGVHVSQLCPGPVATEFEAKAADFEAPAVPKWLEISAPHCVRAALRGFERNRALVVPGLVMKALLALDAIVPRLVRRLILAPFGARVRTLQLAAAPRAAEEPARRSGT